MHWNTFISLETIVVPSEGNVSTAEVSEIFESEPPRKRQRGIDECFLEFGEDSVKTKKIDRAIMQLIASANLPISLVENTAFTNLMKIVSPSLKVKGRTHFTRKELQRVYDEYSNKLKAELSKHEHLSISFDCWSDHANKYQVLAVMCHFNVEKEFVYRLLGVIDVSKERHTGFYLSEKIKDLLEEYSISDKVKACLRDGAGNAASAAEKVCGTQFDCLGHKLNLAVREGTKKFGGLDSLMNKLRKICNKVRKSSISRRSWEKIWEKMEKPSLFLKKDVEVRSLLKNKRIFFLQTRWLSMYEVISRALEVRGELEMFLMEDESIACISLNEWEIAESVVKLLKPVVIAVKQVQDRQFTASSIIPLCRVIIGMLRDDNQEYKYASTAIADRLNLELQIYESIEFLQISTLLDNRFKNCFAEQEWSKKLLQLMNNCEKDCEGCDPVNEIEAGTDTDVFAKFSMRKQRPDASDASRNSKIAGEYARWFAEPVISKVSPMEFWNNRQNQASFQTLAKLVPIYLSTPATTCEVERLFSGARYLLADNRKQLSPENFSKLLFLRTNIPLIGFSE
ncbi:hypothetical protein CRE_06170 [Caenorhabditis remanei]|uniref:HAT C-terminal dimerisation domain-containing protein n=1 Tax=Caenorhabditis remanei TaxID=31234 RepID=E3NIF8_CAERE|nr:hypothetical protein CRE_06170 [Caenorhabditis remanei]